MTLCWGLRWLLALSWILAMDTRLVMSRCPTGQQVKPNGGGCVPCPEGRFRSENSESDICLLCDTCTEGTKTTATCTARSNVKCTCLEGFVPCPGNSYACVCPEGTEVDPTGKHCQTCKTGFFSNIDSKCQKWTDCGKLGVKIQGSPASDVTCYSETDKKLAADTAVTAFSSSVTLRKSTSAVTMTTAASVSQSIVPRVKFPTSPPWVFSHPKATTGSASHYSNEVPFFITAFILLVLCFALICKLAAGLYLKRFKKQIVRAETVCRKPVEESGGKSYSSLVSSTDSSQTVEDV